MTYSCKTAAHEAGCPNCSTCGSKVEPGEVSLPISFSTETPTTLPTATIDTDDDLLKALAERDEARAKLREAEAQAAAMREAINNLISTSTIVVPKNERVLWDQLDASANVDAGRALLTRLEKLEKALSELAAETCSMGGAENKTCADYPTVITRSCYVCRARKALSDLEKKKG